MAQVAAHLSVDDLQARFVASQDACESRHLHTIWLLAKGHTIAEVSDITAFGVRWIEQLLARYNADGPAALGDLRRGNGATASIMRPELLEKLRERLCAPPDDGGLWTSAKVAAWMAAELGLERVAAQRGWEALKVVGWSIQAPRPRNPKAASPEQEAAYKKTRRRGRRRDGQASAASGRGVCH